MTSNPLCEYSSFLISCTYSKNQPSKVKIDSFENIFFFKISTENFEKKNTRGICFFWSQTSRFEPKINLELKNVNKVGAAHLFRYPLAWESWYWVICLRLQNVIFFSARFEFFTTKIILEKLQVSTGKINIKFGHFSFLKISHVDFP